MRLFSRGISFQGSVKLGDFHLMNIYRKICGIQPFALIENVYYFLLFLPLIELKRFNLFTCVFWPLSDFSFARFFPLYSFKIFVTGKPIFSFTSSTPSQFQSFWLPPWMVLSCFSESQAIAFSNTFHVSKTCFSIYLRIHILHPTAPSLLTYFHSSFSIQIM